MSAHDVAWREARGPSPSIPLRRVDDHPDHDLVYAAEGETVTLLVFSDDDWWRAQVLVDGALVHFSEHESRDMAMSVAEQSGHRACRLRRLLKNPPRMPVVKNGTCNP